MTAIHPSAIVETGAEIAPDAEIGAWCHIGAGARIEAGARLLSHVVIMGNATIGARTTVYPFAVIGGPPQHTGYRGEPTSVAIGADCIIREHATIHRGTPGGRGETLIRDRAFIMAAAHIGHDCVIGEGAIIASNASLGGHCDIAPKVFIGGLAGLHQYTRIGYAAYVGGCAAVAMDVIPYGSVLGNRAALGGLNIVGLRRAGATRPMLETLNAAYRDLFFGEGRFAERVDRVAAHYAGSEHVMQIVGFIRDGGARPVMQPRD